MAKRLGIIFSVLLLVFVLAACGDSDNESESSLNEEAFGTEETTEGEEATEPEETKQEDSDNEEIPVLEQAEVKSTVEDIKVTNFKDLDDKKKAFIDDSELTEERIYYGDNAVIALNDSETLLYDLSAEEIVWESDKRNLSVNSHIEDDKVYFSTFQEYLSLDIASGEIVDEYPFDDSHEDYIQVNENYIFGMDLESFQIKNRETGEKVSIPLPEQEYYATALAENALVTEKDGKIASYDNSTGDKLAELEIDGHSAMIRTSGNGDDLYVFVSPEGLSYGYIVQKMDATTLEMEKKVDLENANFPPVVTENAIYYFDPPEGHIVAVDLSLEKELWRYDHEGNDRPYQINAMIGDENGAHIMLGVSDFSHSVYLNLDHNDGEILNFVELDHGFHDNNNEFYLADGKVYIRLKDEGKNIFHVIDKENAHRAFPSKDDSEVD